ncbi:MAG: ATP-binding cassette domain-containing protein [Thermodesulfobacteriota bacterium]|nr:ATP-binding cassette domain-containing protein [Thermodesulfobacteriota bacterium]
MKKSVKITVSSLSFSYHDRKILRNISTTFTEQTITAIIGPSGIGKSTLLCCLNRLWENIPGSRMSGRVQIKLKGRQHDIYDKSYPVSQLRRQVGMVFQNPNPLPMSIKRNIAFPLKLAGEKNRALIEDKIEESLKAVTLWNEVRDRLDSNALSLSGGQQQRLCLARALILDPEILLLDEPTSSLDSRSSLQIEELLLNLKKRCTLLVVSHYRDQVKRIADDVVELAGGKLIQPQH